MIAVVATPARGHMRLIGVDAAKVLACVAVVLTHAGAAGFTIGLAGLSVFALISTVFGMSGAQKRGWLAQAAQSASRLLIPWAIWSGIYGAALLIAVIVEGSGLQERLRPWMFLVGPAPHLWYLPFAFVLTVCLGAMPAMDKYSSDGWPLGIVASVVITLAMVFAARFAALHTMPWSQVLHALPGVAIGLLMWGRKSGRDRWWAVGAAAALAAALAGISSKTFLLQDMGLGVLWAPVAVIVLLQVRICSHKWLARLSDAVFGVYLLHPLLLRVIWMTEVPINSAATAWVVLAISFGAVLLAKAVQPKCMRFVFP